MANELDIVALKGARPDLGLGKGERGTVVFVHPNAACEVEFADADGQTRVLQAFPDDELEVVWHARDVAPEPRRAAR